MKKEQFIKGLGILHLALLVGMLIFMTIAIFLFRENKFDYPAIIDEKILQVVAIIIAGAAVIFSKILFDKKIIIIKNTAEAEKRMTLYREALIKTWVILEMAVLTCIVCYILTTGIAFLMLGGALIIYFILLRPNMIKAQIQAGLHDGDFD